MEKRFVKIKKMIVPVVTMVMIATQLTGCTSASQKELIDMLQKGEYVELELETENPASPLTEINWKQLAALTDQENLRSVIDDQLMILPFGEGLKNGVLYVNPSNGEWEPNNTMENVFKNKKFIEYWEDTEKQAEIQKAVLETYCDVEEDNLEELKLAALNGYFNIFQDNEEEGYFNADSTLSRAQFMAGLTKAAYQANETLQASGELTSQIGNGKYTVFAQYMIDNSFLTLSDKSLNNVTFKGTITKAEAVYMVVQQYYSKEYEKVSGDDKAYDDCKNAGDVAEKLEAKEGYDFVRGYELKYAISEEELPEELYKAMVVAKNHGLLGEVEDSNWSDGITKFEALQLLVNTYKDLGTTCDYERGSGDGSNVAVNNGSLGMTAGGMLTKEQFGAETGLTGEKLDEYYGYYVEGIEEGDSEETAYNTVLNIATFNGDITPANNGDGTTETGNNSAEVADNSKPGSTGNNNSGGNGNSGNGGNSNSGSSSSSNVENDSQNQNDNVYIPSDEDRAAMEALRDGFDISESDPLTDEQRAAEEAAMDGLHGY